MRRLALALVALAGCKDVFGLHDVMLRDAGAGDGAMGDSAMLCLGSGTYAVCMTQPSAPVSLPQTLDTDLSPLCLTKQPVDWNANGQPDACFIVGTTITVMTSAYGSRPLVLVASDTISVSTLDVSSHSGSATLGAGADPATCGAFASAPVATPNGGGGGAGGTFRSVGGAGGAGDAGARAGGRPAAATTTTTFLEAGCPGQAGASGATAALGGVAGPGGGATYLVAGQAIDLTGATIAASGAGGGGGGSESGGGGGGSGGMIVLHAPVIGASGAVLVANGGGGGGGGSGGTPGTSGADPSTVNVNSQAEGGTGGALGGLGFAGTTDAKSGTQGADSIGGGGGGGGSGLILTSKTLGSTMISPPPVVQ
jgi:hypothetical protein